MNDHDGSKARAGPGARESVEPQGSAESGPRSGADGTGEGREDSPATALKDSCALLELALQGGDIGLYGATLPDGRLQADDRLLAILGYRSGEIVLDLAAWRLLLHPDDLSRLAAVVAAVSGPDGPDRYDLEYRMRHRDGRWLWVLDRARVFGRDDAGRALRIAGTLMDVTRRKTAEARIEYLVDHDELTGLLNRRGIWRAVQRIHAQAARSGAPQCLAMLDLDHFKLINDAYGHAAGDRVLRIVASRLQGELRAGDWLGRWGGEEFLLCLPDTTAAQGLATVERLRQVVAAMPIDLGGQDVQITLSAGLAPFEPGTGRPGDLVALADAALYRAKAAGRDRVCLAGADEDEALQSLAALVQQAVRGQGLQVAFQPIVDLGATVAARGPVAPPAAYPIVGEQCLARLTDIAGQVLPAAAFIDVARELGVLHRVDQAIFEAAVARLRVTPRARHDALTRFVHLSADLLRQDAVIEALARSLAGLPGPGVTGIPLAVTLGSGQAAAADRSIGERIAPLLQAGCRLAVADVGGDVAFRLLAELPVRYLHIAPALIPPLRTSARARTIVRGIAAIARELDVVTIARPVEDQAVCNLLRDLGVRWAQGRLFAAPSEPIGLRAAAG
jgi:diguanylate cyclase (GGDEF)-like protein/PAS domain S-box-containing protein